MARRSDPHIDPDTPTIEQTTRDELGEVTQAVNTIASVR